LLGGVLVAATFPSHKPNRLSQDGVEGVLAAHGLTDAVDRLQKKREPCPSRQSELKGGRPMK
jgi:hypothetical protein